MASNIEVDRPPVAPGEIEEFSPRRPASIWLRLRRNPGAMIGLVLIVVLIVVALTAGILRPEGYDRQVLRDGLLPPGGAHVLGTDELGRDLVSRIVYGARISLQVGVIATVISAFVGIFLGAVAGYMGGKVDYAIQALVDISWAFPTVLMAIFMVAVLGPGLMNVMIAVGLVYWGGYARVVRGQILSLREWDFVTAARCLGASPARIILRHMLPNVIAPVIVMSSLMMGDAILIEATLSFLGMGAQPPVPSWGSILASGRSHMALAPWVMIFPGLAIMLTVLGFNLLGDGLRDATDPRLR